MNRVEQDHQKPNYQNPNPVSPDVQGPEELGKAIAYRLAMREEAAAQVRVVDTLAKSSAAADLVFCGSGALHGCYLHGRRTGCLDFIALPNTIMGLVSTLRDAGLGVEQALAQHEYAITARGKAVTSVTVKIRMYPYCALLLETEARLFCQQRGQTTEIRTLTLLELVLAKLAHLYLRERPFDYVDIWMALKRMPEVMPQLQRMLTARGSSGSSHAPPYPFDTAFLIRRLQRMEAVWVASTSVLSIDASSDSLPSFHSVKDDLNQWLPLLSDGDGT